ncbi:HAD family hydrolase [Pantoea sp. MBD-2R]|uniref:HAD family hydrolase n=1 Tax=Pantoea sp. MBD-2R TaxID=3141540 RepID=UPI003182E7F4
MASIDSIIVLDIDGTLTDSVPAHQHAFEQALRFFPFQALSTDWGRYTHHSDSGIFYEAWQKANFVGEPDLATLEEAYLKAYPQALKRYPVSAIPGAAEFIATLSESWGIVFATGSLRSGALHKLGVLGIDADEVVLVTSSEFASREELVKQAVGQGCRKFGIKAPRRVVSIGDGIWDLKTANNLGYEFLGIGEGEKAAHLSASGAEVYPDFIALLKDRQLFSSEPIAIKES